MSVKENISTILKNIPEQVQLVAVSKTKPNEMILEAYQHGQRIFGENKVQELSRKAEELPQDIEWHFIGHMQTNKVKYIAPFVSLMHGVDSLKLLKTINKEAKKNNRVIRCLLQFHVAEEETKFGLNEAEAHEILTSDAFLELQNVEVVGIMGMATNTTNKKQISSEFAELAQIFERIRTKYFSECSQFKEISMGMSGDYQLAIEAGSTLVRVGSSIFGTRTYPA